MPSEHRLSPALPFTFRFIPLSIALLALGGCSLFSEPWMHRDRAPAVEAPAKPTGLPPVATHRFEFDPDRADVLGLVQITTVGAEDTLPDIARRFDVGYEELVRANPGVDPWLPGVGREIIVPSQFVLPNAPREGLVINVPAMRLFYYPARKKDEPAVVITYPIGIGKVGWSTPEGTTKIIARTQDPTWRVPVSVRKEHLEMGDELPAVVPPGPDNPLGKHSFTLGWPSYLVHGTNKPYGVGMRSSHGCIRLYPEDILQLFDTVPIGTKLRVVNQPYLVGRAGDDIVVQSYGALEDDKRQWDKSRRKLIEKSMSDAVHIALKERALSIDWERVEKLAQDAHGVPVSVIVPDASLEAVLASARRVENVVPEGSNWDGHVDVDEEKFQELLSDREPATADAAAGAGPETLPR
jgi:L,D-transpeptidase ErfK/SrfK